MKGQFLFVKEITAEFQASDAHQHDAATLATGLGGHMHRLTGSGGSGDQHTIHADTCSVLQTPRDGIGAVGEMKGSNTKRFGQLTFGIRIEPEHAAALSHKELACEQTNQPRPLTTKVSQRWDLRGEFLVSQWMPER